MKLFSGNGHNSNSGPRSRRNSARSGGKRSAAKRTGRGILIFLAVIAAIAGGFRLYWVLSTAPPEMNVDPDEGFDPVAEAEALTGNRYYFTLVVGEDQLGNNTDTIMLVRYDSQENTANILSIPRDTVLNVPWSAKRINAAYKSGEDGIQSLMDEVERITGCRPNNYVFVNMQVFIDVVDAMGGVWFDVPCDMNYDDYAFDNFGNPYEFTIHVTKGRQLLNGYDAIGVFRFRQNNNGTGYPGGDWERIEVQHDLMMTIAEQAMRTRNLGQLMEIAYSVMDNCTTDLKMANIQWYFQEFLKMSMNNISFYTIPTVGCWVNGNAYVTINAEAWLPMLNEHFYPHESEIKAEDLPLFQAKNPEIDRYSVTPDNYFVTNGDEPYTNFPRSYGT